MEAAFRALTRRGGFYRGRGGKYHGGSNPRRDFRPKNYLSPIRDGHHQSEHKSQHSENMNHREERVKETSHNKRRRRRSSSSDERRATEAKREKSECDKAKDVRKAKPKSDKSSKVEKSKPKDDKAHDKMQVLNRSKEFLGDKGIDFRVHN